MSIRRSGSPRFSSRFRLNTRSWTSPPSRCACRSARSAGFSTCAAAPAATQPDSWRSAIASRVSTAAATLCRWLSIGRQPQRSTVLDVRAIGRLGEQFDGVLLLWQSFGYFSPKENDQLLRDIRVLLRPGGRLLLDVFHADYFRRHQGPRSKLPNGVSSLEDRVVRDRLHSRIEYDDGTEETMDFEIFTPEQLAERAGRAGLRLVESCCWWDQGRPPDPGQTRFQLTLERDAK